MQRRSGLMKSQTVAWARAHPPQARWPPACGRLLGRDVENWGAGLLPSSSRGCGCGGLVPQERGAFYSLLHMLLLSHHSPLRLVQLAQGLSAGRWAGESVTSSVITLG